MYLKDEKIVVQVDGVVFRSYQLQNPQYVLDPTAIVGWYDGVNVRRDATVRPNAWGDFSEKGRMGARSISLSGSAVANTAGQLVDMRDDFMAILNDGSYRDISVEDGRGVRYATVGLEGSSTWLKQHDTFAAWRIEFYAPDPRLYSERKYVKVGQRLGIGGLDYPLDYPLNYNESVSGDPSLVTNTGNTDSWPEFKVSGTFNSGFTITDGLNKKVTYRGVVTPQSPVTINMGTGTALQNGVDKTVRLTDRDWISIPARQTLRPSFSAIGVGEGWCDIIYRDTWI